MKHTSFLFVLPLLAACQPAPTAPDAAGPGARPIGGNACDAAQYAGQVGGPFGDLRYPDDQEVRLINPGEMVTMEFNPDRLNIEIDTAGRVIAVTCG
ncbi:I78 family peptidase inhibitor [Loktanella salsilacus]|uniref:I78 family peptidase inhibitor n=1 Tax=Loktanella salsilacus TaxID=195913 RepID=UPI003735CEDB